MTDKPSTDTESAAHASTEKSEADILALIEALNVENASLKDKALRTMADMENLRRRTEKEVADARVYAVTGFARDMLSVADNARRGIESIPADALAGADGPFKALVEGVELIERDLLKTLERHGIKKLEPHGQKFDPNLHQAMFEVDDASVPSGTVTQVVQAGFVIGDRVLRPALVGVAKGGPKGPATGGVNATA
jgi:molecular chaperone GrpE